jgi:hypothetical protein
VQQLGRVILSLFDTMLNFVENLLENERDPRSAPMNDQDHSLSLSDPDRSLVFSHFLTNFLQNLASCHTAFRLGFTEKTFATASTILYFTYLHFHYLHD